MTRECKTCEYKDGEYCKRYPPKAIILPVGFIIEDFDSIYPITKNYDWCGEYKKIYKQEDTYFNQTKNQ